MGIPFVDFRRIVEVLLGGAVDQRTGNIATLSTEHSSIHNSLAFEGDELMEGSDEYWVYVNPVSGVHKKEETITPNTNEVYLEFYRNPEVDLAEFEQVETGCSNEYSPDSPGNVEIYWTGDAASVIDLGERVAGSGIYLPGQEAAGNLRAGGVRIEDWERILADDNDYLVHIRQLENVEVMNCHLKIRWYEIEE